MKKMVLVSLTALLIAGCADRQNDNIHVETSGLTGKEQTEAGSNDIFVNSSSLNAEDSKTGQETTSDYINKIIIENESETLGSENKEEFIKETYSGWKEGYKAILDTLYDKSTDNSGTPVFGVFDLNQDGVPEIAAGTWSDLTVYSYDNEKGRILPLKEFQRSVLFVDNENGYLVADSSYGTGCGGLTQNRLTEGMDLAEISRLEFWIGWDSIDSETYYYCDEEIDESGYEAYYNEFMNTAKELTLHQYSEELRYLEDMDWQEYIN